MTTALLLLLVLFIAVKKYSLSLTSLSSNENGNHDIYIGKLEEFSKSSIVALHFPCKESNMFSTNCACHIKCKSPKCENAVDVCRKYQVSHSCHYVLLRGGKNNKFATLKRYPSTEEQLKYSVAEFSPSVSDSQATTRWSRKPPQSTSSFAQLLADDQSARAVLTDIQDQVQV